MLLEAGKNVSVNVTEADGEYFDSNFEYNEHPGGAWNLTSDSSDVIHYALSVGDTKKGHAVACPFCSRSNLDQPNFAPLILMPGPIVDAITQDLMYWPFAAAGFALMIALSRVEKFSPSFSAPKEALPMGQ